MSAFLEAAKQVLSAANEPLSVREITERAMLNGLLPTGGKTPSQTMKSKLATDIRRRGGASIFMRIGAGRFALRHWTVEMPEYFARRFKASLLDEEVLVFPATSIGKYVASRGVQSATGDTESLLGECRPMRRRLAEQSTDFIQLVSVYVLRYRDEFLTYKRSRRLPESRLHGTYSLAFGGHLNPDDAAPLLSIFYPGVGLPLILRELSEEVRLPKEQPPEISYAGLLYDDSRDVSKQHLGIVYEVRLASPTYEIGERGFLLDPQFETAAQINGHLEDFE